MTPPASEEVPDEDEADHLAEVPDGSGCTEIWEHLAERRERERTAAEADADPDGDGAADESEP